jgi:PAS domain S-box-containing protein
MWPNLTSEKRGWTGLVVRWRHRNGQYRYLESNAVPILNSSGKLIGYRGSDRDITERLLAEEGLRKAEEYRNLFKLANDSIIVFEPEEEIVLDVNDKACEVYGIPRDSFIGMSLKRISQDVAKGETQLKKLLEVGTYQEFESVQFRSDGTAINLLINASVIEYQGRIAVLSINRDVTERKQAEYKLENSVSIIRATLEATADAILVISNSGEVVTCNQKFLQMWQIADQEAFVSRNQWMQQYALNQVKNSDDFLLEFERLLADPDAENWNSIEFRDGRVIEQYSQPQRINGQTVGRVWSFRDLSDRKNLEEQLRQSQKLEAVGQLAGGVAHDFNNLLTGIIGYSELIISEVEKGSYLHQSILEIRKAGEHAASLTRQLLAFSRKQVMQPRILDLNDVVVEMNKMLRRLIGENIDLVTALDQDLGRVKADPGQIQQVIINLVVNARDAMPKGGKVVIELSNAYLDEDYAGHHISVQPGWYAMLAVSDTGCGMTAEVQKRVFEPFFTTKEVGKGTGLGLSTVFGIVKQSGGNIWVYSEMGKGTTFKVYLPLIERAVEKIEVDVERKSALGGTESILLVEDEEMVRKMTCTILAMNGYEVLVAANGVEALQLVEEHQGLINLILTDVVMPKMDGSELVEIIIRKRPEARVLFMSGYTDDAIVHHGVLAEGIPFIEKPFTPRSLACKIREVLDNPAPANILFRDGASD